MNRRSVRRLLVMVLALAFLFAVAADVSASSRSRAAAPVGGPDPATATISVKASIVEVSEGGRKVLLRPEESDGRQVLVELEPGIRIRAQNKKMFDGKKKLEHRHLAAGQRLRLTFLPAENRILSIVILKSEAT